QSQPERRVVEHRRRLQRTPQRGRPDAASGTRLRKSAGQRRRQMDLRKHDRGVAEPGNGEGGLTASTIATACDRRKTKTALTGRCYRNPDRFGSILLRLDLVAEPQDQRAAVKRQPGV